MVDSNPASGNLFLPEVGARYCIPPCGASNFLDAILKLIEQEGIEFLYSGLDEEMPVLARNRGAIEAAGCQLLLPCAESLEQALDKRAAQSRLEGKVVMPHCRYLDDEFDAGAFYDEVNGDVMIKANASRGGRYIYVPEDRDEYDFVLGRVGRLMREQGLEFMAQEMIRGAEYNVSSLHDVTGEQIYAVSRRKFESRVIKSTTTAAAIERCDEVIEPAMAAVRALGLTRGFNNVELIVSSTDGRPYFIEVNGGRTAAQDMNLVASGINISELMIDILRGEPVAPIPHPPDGISTLKIRRDVIVNYADIENMSAPLDE